MSEKQLIDESIVLIIIHLSYWHSPEAEVKHHFRLIPSLYFLGRGHQAPQQGACLLRVAQQEQEDPKA